MKIKKVIIQYLNEQGYTTASCWNQADRTATNLIIVTIKDNTLTLWYYPDTNQHKEYAQAANIKLDLADPNLFMNLEKALQEQKERFPK